MMKFGRRGGDTRGRRRRVDLEAGIDVGTVVERRRSISAKPRGDAMASAASRVVVRVRGCWRRDLRAGGAGTARNSNGDEEEDDAGSG